MPGHEFTNTDLKKRIEYFSEEEIVSIDKFSVDSYEIETTSGVYSLDLLEPDRLPAMQSAVKAAEWVSNSGFDVTEIISCGLLADLDSAFVVKKKTDGETLESYLRRVKKNEARESGIAFGQALHRLHDTKIKDALRSHWTELVNTTIDLVMYQYSMLRDKGPHDYLLLDFITANRHLLDKALQRTVVGSLTLHQIFVNGEQQFELTDLASLQIGDDVYDFVFLNDAAMIQPSFANGVLYGYYGEYPPRNFFRFLSLYTAIVMMQRIVKIQTGDHKKTEIDQMMEKEMKIIESYTDFADIVPTWIEPRHMW